MAARLNSEQAAKKAKKDAELAKAKADKEAANLLF
jgi:hypothetical protein